MDVSWLALMRKMASNAKLKKKHAKKEKKDKKDSKKAAKKAKVVATSTTVEPCMPIRLPDMHAVVDPLPSHTQEAITATMTPIGVIQRSDDAVLSRWWLTGCAWPLRVSHYTYLGVLSFTDHIDLRITC